MPNTTQNAKPTQRKAPPPQKKNLFWEVLGTLLSPEQNTIYRVRGGVDRVFLLIVVLLVCYGSIMIASASYVFARSQMGDSFYFIKKQLLWVTVGIIAMIVMSFVDYGFLKKATPTIFAISYFLLLLVFVPGIGVSHKGARRWIDLKIIEFQPSDVMKFALVLMMALYISKFQQKVKSFQYGLLCPACIVVLVCGTVALEKHMSATIILFIIGAAMIFIAGADMKWVGGIGATFATAAAGLILFTDYTKARVDAWLHPENDPGGSSWQPYQSLLAIGSGGIFGVGLGNSYQKHLWLPEPQNDFIFAIVCEELGMIGAFTMIALFMILMWRGFVIALKAPDTFSAMLVMGLTLKVSIQAILNIAVVTTTIPTTGIALPFFSYGGTALIMQLAEMGIILSISRFSSGEKSLFEAKSPENQLA
jgi:cell division protein FtsW